MYSIRKTAVTLLQIFIIYSVAEAEDASAFPNKNFFGKIDYIWKNLAKFG